MKKLANSIQSNCPVSYKWTAVKKGDVLKMVVNYLDGVTFTASKLGEEALILRDENGENIGYVIIGEDRWSDAPNFDAGYEMAVKAIVNYFNRVY